MRALYAESSAVLAWLLGEPVGNTVRAALVDAGEVLTSDLTFVECDRALIQARIVRRPREPEVAGRRRALETAASHWGLLRISPAIIHRARQPFPGHSIRTLVALNLASALGAAEIAEDLALLS